MSTYNQNIFADIFAYAAARYQSARDMRFVHYTSAETAISIIANRAVWMRNARAMNDYSELEYGTDCILQALDSPAGKALEHIIKSNFDQDAPWLLIDIRKRLYEHLDSTYIACISEHCSKEDFYGRLSMWRAYGGNSGVAIVLKNRPFITPNDKLGANTYPVYYLSKSDFANLFDKLVDNIIRNIQTIRNNNAFLTDLWLQLQSLQFCIKHPGFGEEKEWRVVYRPKYNPTEHIPGEIRSVRGTPQQIYTLRLEDIPEADFFPRNARAIY